MYFFLKYWGWNLIFLTCQTSAVPPSYISSLKKCIFNNYHFVKIFRLIYIDITVFALSQIRSLSELECQKSLILGISSSSTMDILNTVLYLLTYTLLFHFPSHINHGLKLSHILTISKITGLGMSYTLSPFIYIQHIHSRIVLCMN